MSRDGKLGLVLGVGLVLTIAITFFRKDQATATPSTTTAVNTQQAKPGPPTQPPSFVPELPPAPPPVEQTPGQ